MNATGFWSLINQAHRDTENEDELIVWLSRVLSTAPTSEAQEFLQYFIIYYDGAYTTDCLYTALIQITHRLVITDEEFSAFCVWLVAQGESAYATTLTTPINVYLHEGKSWQYPHLFQALHDVLTRCT